MSSDRDNPLGLCCLVTDFPAKTSKLFVAVLFLYSSFVCRFAFENKVCLGTAIGSNNNEADTIDDTSNTEDRSEDDNDPLNAGTSESILISDNDITILIAPGKGGIPISIVKDKDSDFLSFPKVYYGQKLEGWEYISYSSLTKSVPENLIDELPWVLTWSCAMIEKFCLPN
ncbi:uncharacterized protein EV154DRAFT_580126 [Mucor mucedo]|uniref:uncharacterized protein n=1 Tax=Mucor mucedo TaxID=29922 RepID=UPI002220CE1D|nr:uncharacterized protein EV154DRAFT_580126 [Mucor mucedo]KAI7872230.1 hypothetical protein EV154DRAFT_580126 [Mucor mucedo]